MSNDNVLVIKKEEADSSPVPSAAHEEEVYVPEVTVRRVSTPDNLNTPYRYEVSIGTAEVPSHAAPSTLPQAQNGEIVIVEREDMPVIEGYTDAGTQRITAYNVEGGKPPRLLLSYLRNLDGRMSKLYLYLDDNREVQLGPPRSEPDGN